MYIARFARQDLLPTMITRRDEVCDRKLLKIIKYNNGTVEWRQVGFVGNTTKQLQLGLFSDADFVGDGADVNNTSGVSLALIRPTQLLPALRAEQEADGGVAQHRRGRGCGGRPRSSNERAASP